MLQREFRLMEQEAQNHYQHFLQFKVKQLPQTIFILTLAKTLLIFILVKVFIAWREETASAVSGCRQQREALTRFQMFQNKGTAEQIFQTVLKYLPLKYIFSVTGNLFSYSVSDFMIIKLMLFYT